MPGSAQGVVAAGHPHTAEAGAAVLRTGGNAVDAAIAAMLTSFACEPLLTGLGAGGYMLVAGFDEPPALLDFFVESPGRQAGGAPPREPLLPFEVDFGDASQLFHAGAASCGVYGVPAGVCAALARWGTVQLAALAAPAAELARSGVELNHEQAYVAEILEGILTSTPECAALWAPRGEILREGELLRDPALGDALELLAEEGSRPFYRGEPARRVCEAIAERGGTLGAADLAGYEAFLREPTEVAYRDRTILTNPPPSAGGTLLAYSLSLLARAPGPPSLAAVVAAMEAAQSERTPQFLEGLRQPNFLDNFLASRLGSTTHISVLDGSGRACSVTCTNGEGSGIVVPGTGIHVNNIMGEQDLNPLGFHLQEPGQRMPSMMAPTLVLDADSRVELVLGSAGSNRIRSALLQTIVGAVDGALSALEAISAPRVHIEDGVLYAEPGIDTRALERPGLEVARFHAPNLFFGGVQAVQRRGSQLAGAGDPRRGGVAVSA
ncbi:MAG: gamma-glutamyltransferase [Solirubrobacteraceae bacterium]